LKRIQEDRELQRRRLGNTSSREPMVIDAAAATAATPAHISDSGGTEATDRTHPSEAENSLLQVRLSGHCRVTLYYIRVRD